MRTWLKIEHTIASHRKTKHLARLWKCHPYTVVGFLVSWWGYMIEYQSDGQAADVPREDLDELATPCAVHDRNVLADLRSVGFVDPDGTAHDWQDYAGALLARRERDRERKRLSRGRPADILETSAESPYPRVEQSRVEQSERLTSRALRAAPSAQAVSLIDHLS